MWISILVKHLDIEMALKIFPISAAEQGVLTHWGRATHVCVDKPTIIGSDNGLSPGRRQAIIWTNAAILLIGPLGTNFSEILIRIQTFSFRKMHWKISSAKWRPFCLGLNELTQCQLHHVHWVMWVWWCKKTLAVQSSIRDQPEIMLSIPILFSAVARLWLATIIIPPASTKLKGGYTAFTLSVCPSVRLSVCGENHVHSVSSTILVRSISYLHILSSNFRMCVVAYVCFKSIQNWNFGEFFKFVTLTLCSFDLGYNMTQWYE